MEVPFSRIWPAGPPLISGDGADDGAGDAAHLRRHGARRGATAESADPLERRAAQGIEPKSWIPGMLPQEEPKKGFELLKGGFFLVDCLGFRVHIVCFFVVKELFDVRVS